VSGSESYTYDGRGLRTSEAASGSVTPFTWDTVDGGSLPLLLDDGTNAYLYGPSVGGVEAPVEQITMSSNTPKFLSSTPSGVQLVFSGTGALAEEANYSPYGVQALESGTSVTPFGFQGGYTDPSKLIYMVNRYYDPNTDQFISVDPDLAGTGQPYAFTGDNPMDFDDPLGIDKACWGDCQSWSEQATGDRTSVSQARALDNSGSGNVAFFTANNQCSNTGTDRITGAAICEDQPNYGITWLNLPSHLIFNLSGCLIFCGDITFQGGHVSIEVGAVGLTSLSASVGLAGKTACEHDNMSVWGGGGEGIGGQGSVGINPKTQALDPSDWETSIGSWDLFPYGSGWMKQVYPFGGHC
jgi:RHS repeat-associated protein